jgi:hypothetical protein
MKMEPRPIQPIAAATLAERLREATPQIIVTLGGKPPRGPKWRFETRDEIDIEWNRSELGPSTYASWTWKTKSAEAVVRFDTIRWSRFEVHRMEVTGLWEAGGRRAVFFARGEEEAAITEVRTADVVWTAIGGDVCSAR